MGEYNYKESWCDICKRDEETSAVCVYSGQPPDVMNGLYKIKTSQGWWTVAGDGVEDNEGEEWKEPKKKDLPKKVKLDLCYDCRRAFLRHLELVKKGKRKMV